MATLDKEIKVIAVKGQRGYSSYEEAVANDYFSGTLEEWIETYATPENYVTRDEFKKVTQAEYDALEEAGELIPNCYYIITDDTSYTDLVERIDNMAGDVEDVVEEFEASMEIRMEAVEEAVRTGLRMSLTNIVCACDFTNWNNLSTGSISSGSEIDYISLRNTTYTDNRVNILPAGTITSVAEAKVEYVSGDSGYIEYQLQAISGNANYIEFKAMNISSGLIYPPLSEQYAPTNKETTFRIYVKDIYDNEFTKEFTVNYKAV